VTPTRNTQALAREKTLVVHSHAKINLYLDVLQRRRDGFTNIETLFQSVALQDTLEGSVSSDEIHLTCNLDDLPTGPDNLVCRAASLLRAVSGVDRGAQLHLTKRIPVAAGLAGGSGNAAATLVLLNRLWQLDWPVQRLLSLARKLGSDVPYCLIGGTVAATSRGVHLEIINLPAPLWVVLVHPPVQISTAAMYTHPRLTRNTQQRFAGKTPAFRRALRALRDGAWVRVVFNRMESAAFAEYPELADIKAELLSRRCLAAAMSGSGPTLFGLCRDEQDATAVASGFSGLQTTVVPMCARGLQFDSQDTLVDYTS